MSAFDVLAVSMTGHHLLDTCRLRLSLPADEQIERCGVQSIVFHHSYTASNRSQKAAHLQAAHPKAATRDAHQEGQGKQAPHAPHAKLVV
jgi:hypothetical protein